MYLMKNLHLHGNHTAVSPMCSADNACLYCACKCSVVISNKQSPVAPQTLRTSKHLAVYLMYVCSADCVCLYPAVFTLFIKKESVTMC